MNHSHHSFIIHNPPENCLMNRALWKYCSLTLLLLFPVAGIMGQSGPEKPNVLFISIDDMNDWNEVLGGHPGIATPNLNRLAERSITFTRAYAPAPICNPSRTAVMTGIRPSTSGVYENQHSLRKSPVLKEATTLPQHFSAHGYRSFGGGKIFHHAIGPLSDPQSWDEQLDYRAHDWPKPEKVHAHGIPGANTQFDWGPLEGTDEDTPDWQVAQWAADLLLKKQDKPFFLAAGIFRPHLPWYVPKEYFESYPLHEVTLPAVNPADLEDVPPVARAIADPHGDFADVVRYGQWHKAVQGYAASIIFADRLVGIILDALDKGPHGDNTIIVLWSDHGWHLGEKLTFRKKTLWEEAARANLMVALPDGKNAGSRSSRTVNLLDIYPTLIELCGLPPGKEIEGTSLISLLEDPQAPWKRPSLTTFLRNDHSVRSERWRYTRYADGSEELYDHRNDSNEWNNLADNPEYAQIKQSLAQWFPETNAPSAPKR